MTDLRSEGGGLIPGRSGGGFFFSRFFWCWIFLGPPVSEVARKRSRPFYKKCRWQVCSPKYTHDTTKTEWADCAVQASFGNLLGIGAYTQLVWELSFTVFSSRWANLGLILALRVKLVRTSRSSQLNEPTQGLSCLLEWIWFARADLYLKKEKRRRGVIRRIFPHNLRIRGKSQYP